ncbi:uncharacterized protein B0H18DRAFT_1062986 [Fomitopsis serialis]|uniref:uncharacterized protein n=1 Tax=Fomitopsis serialis TaxID=139415 RepID=UPI002008D7AB|nr:uncharacterized protein B0H18DRAFT_1062986 [Neoantrodia serialis]KAH9911386.1 hypothetical protein B0H18DRAFT_1062986 [Neoantrodia serialis]
MALDLLRDAYWNGNLKRIYRHDLESFVWVVLYFAWAFDDEGREDMDSPVHAWLTADYEQCRRAKGDFLMIRAKQRPDNRTHESGDDGDDRDDGLEYVPFFARQLRDWLVAERLRQQTKASGDPRNPFTESKRQARGKKRKKRLLPEGNHDEEPLQEAKRDFDSFWNEFEYIRKASKDVKMTPEGVEYFKSREKKLT